MTTNHPLTLTVEQAAQVLGIGRSTAYELVRSGDLQHIRLRRRIVVPVSHLAERLGLNREAVWVALASTAVDEPDGPASAPPSTAATSRSRATADDGSPSLF